MYFDLKYVAISLNLIIPPNVKDVWIVMKFAFRLAPLLLMTLQMPQLNVSESLTDL